MSGITRGVVVGLLLAGAVAGAAAFPRLFAGPGNDQTPGFALVPAAAQPAIVQAPALPLPRLRLSLPTKHVAVAPVVQRAAPVHIASKPIVIHHIVPPAPVVTTPAKAPAPAPKPVETPIPAAAPVPAPPARSVAANPVPTTPAAPPPLGSDHYGPPAQQAPPGTDSNDGGGVRHLEAPDPGAAPQDHGHGPPPWAHGGGKGH